jgi:transketolase
MKLTEIQVLNEKETRGGFGEGIYEIGKENENVVVLTADLAGSMKIAPFIKDFPDRYVQVGIAEANMIGIAAGMTIGGKIPYTTTFANFSTGRVYDQIRQSVAYSGKNVKICASHAGLTLGEDGATSYEGPVYLRFGRPKWPNFTKEDGSDFVIGKAQQLSEGTDVSIFACGHMVWKAIEAGRLLEAKGVSVELINIHTIKPLDTEAIIKSITKTKCAVTVEEHNIIGGLGDAIAQVAAKNLPIPIEYIGTKDTFGESGKPNELLTKYGLDTPFIVEAVEKVMKRK